MDTWAKFILTDGTKSGTFDLLRFLKEWLPQLAAAKSGGSWSGSPYAQGRQLFDKQLDNIINTFILEVYANGQADAIDLLDQITTLLDKAVGYWINDYQSEMVWAEMRLSCQEESQYTIIYDWSIPQLAELFVAPFSQNGTLENITLILEHGLWMENEPTESTQIELDNNLSYIDATTTRKKIWVTNYLDNHPISHIYVFDASGPTYTDILAVSATSLFPAVPAAGDILYVGRTDGGLTVGPFDNIIFNIGIAQSGLTIVPEYSRGAGAWGNISTYGYAWVDDTNSFQRTGPNTIVFDFPGGANPWQPDVINGVTAWWIRFRVSAAVAPVTPTIVDRIYTNIYPYFIVPSDQISGTYPAQMKYELWRRDISRDFTNVSDLIGTKVLLGLRSLDRGTFHGFFPAYQLALRTGYTYTMNLGAAFAYTNVPWYYGHRWVPGGAVTDAIVGYWIIADPYSLPYNGTYRMFLRLYDNFGDIQTRIALAYGAVNNIVWVSPYRQVASANVQAVLDFGLITIQRPNIDTTYPQNIYFIIVADSTAASTNVAYFDIVLIPADECIVDLQVTPNSAWQAFYQDGILMPDSISRPKSEITADLLSETITGTKGFVRSWQIRTPGEVISNVNQEDGQSVWTFLLHNNNYLTGGEPDYRAVWSTAISLRGWRNQRYKTLKG